MSEPPIISGLLSRAAHLVQTTNQPSNDPINHALIADLEKYNIKLPKILIITCADPRCDPGRIFGLKPMEAIIFRNPGGHVAPVINSVLALESLFGGFEGLLVLHHTDCGTTMFTDEQVRESLRARVKGAKVEDLTFGAIDGTKVEEGVRDDLRFLKEHPLVTPEMKKTAVGALYDVESGLITKVD